jgi:hypothetical protein
MMTKLTEDDSFHYSISPIMKLMQNISIMPLENIKKNDPNSIKFQWKSFRFFFSLAFLTYGTFEASFMYIFLKEDQGGITAKNIGKYSILLTISNWIKNNNSEIFYFLF